MASPLDPYITTSVFRAINAPAGSHPPLDALMIFGASWLIFCWPLLLLLVWGVPLSWRKRPLRPGEAGILQERRALVVWVAQACLLAYGLNLLIEHVLFEPRPFIGHTVHLLIAHAADASFPSDHAAWSFAVVGMVLFAVLPLALTTLRKRAGVTHGSTFAPLRVPGLLLLASLALACAIGVARIYVGVHYPGDILGGALDGLVAALVVTLVRWRVRQPTNAVLRFAQVLHLA
jgi:undecaprenyl-diphosphatase